MITLSNIFIQYGDRILLNRINLVIGPQDKAGLVGRNGAGKSTLLKIIAGEMSPHDGKVVRPTGSTLGFLHQEMDIPKGKSVLEETMTAFAEFRAMEEQLEKMHEELDHRTDYESDSYHQLLDDFTSLNDRLHAMGSGSAQGDAERVLKGLGFKQKDLTRLTDEFSGGWQMRIELAKMLLRRPDYLLLDEPTNHLDIESILWLEGFLKDYSKAVVVISHDREFLNNVTKRTVEVELGNVFDYKVAYKEFVAYRQDRREKQKAAFDNQQRVIADRERTINRFMAKATKTKMAQSMQKQLDKLDRIELEDEDLLVMNLRFPPAPRSGHVVADAKRLQKRYGDLLVLDGVDFHIERGERVAFVGQNGQGKSTLAKMIVNEVPSSGGTLQLGHNVQIGYYAQNQSEALKSGNTVLETAENESPAEMRPKVRAILGAFMFSGEDVEKKVSVLSGGERARLALACLLLKPFNLLVLDEPTNHLDMLSKDVLKKALMEYDGTLLVVSHDRDFLGDLTTRTIEFKDRKLYEFLGDVNYFLDKRALDNMRQVELQKPAAVMSAPAGNGQPATEKKKPALSFEDRKRLQRAVQNAEKKIEKLEEEMAKFEVDMADTAFFSRPGAQNAMQQYQEKKQELERAMLQWEQAQAELEEAE
ncbi:MAG: ABC-F family ATP-binding cassette domain-containing protein [Haliscomenobacter sp.]|nr:ABC-F family ATP-binding cassette domain-containing protein [Haliscomenobacter sp.]